jgi:DNA-binding transcriptional LysR family regulator
LIRWHPNSQPWSLLLAGQDVFTVFSMQAKLDAQIRGLGTGFLPTCLAQPYIDAGRLVAKRVQRPEPEIYVSYAWRRTARSREGPALHWWLEQLQSPATRSALLGSRRTQLPRRRLSTRAHRA